MSKTIKILIVVLIIAVFGVIGYLVYKNYYIVSDSVVQTENDWTNYNNELLSKSVFGVIKDVNDDSITVIDQDNNEKTYKINSVTQVEKLDDVSDDGTQSFVQAEKSNLEMDQNIWIIADSVDSSLAMTIKITNTNTDILPTPTPSAK